MSESKIIVTVSKTIQEARFEPYEISATVEAVLKSTKPNVIKKKFRELQELLAEEVRTAVIAVTDDVDEDEED